MAINALLRALWSATASDWLNAQPRINLVARLLAEPSPARMATAQQWRTLALRQLYRFRALSLRYRHTTRFKTLFQQLCRLPTFSALWMQTQQAERDVYSYVQVDADDHPTLGQLNYLVTHTTTLTPYDTLYLVTLAPTDAHTAATFADLDQSLPKEHSLLATWPNPELADE